MDMINLEEYIEAKRQLVDRALNACLPAGAPELISSAMRYSIEAGGKRLRPILVIATSEALGSSNEEVMEVACAVELVHTYSLIHDDLPAMDDSSLRRGVPTCHRVYGDAMAILTGDAFLTLAFEMVARFGLKEGCAERSVNIAALLAQSAGIKGMVGGQVLDLLAEGKKLDLKQVENIAALKTGALLRASVKSGAIASGASKQQLELLDQYGSALGKAFQIVDDLLDYEKDSEVTGKPVGIDQERGKATYPALLGKENAREKANSFLKDALAALEKLDCPTELLVALARMLVFRIK